MRDIVYMTGDATRPVADGAAIIAHICNDVGGWGRGFVLALSRRWPDPERAYRKWHREGADFSLGNIQLVQVDDNLHVANMIGQRGIKTTTGNGTPIRYDAVEACLEKLSAKAAEMGAGVHMPRIGCGLAGGRWENIEPLIRKTLSDKGIEVFVYDI